MKEYQISDRRYINHRRVNRGDDISQIKISKEEMPKKGHVGDSKRGHSKKTQTTDDKGWKWVQGKWHQVRK